MNSLPQLTLRNKKTGEKKIYRLDQPRVLIGRDPSNYVVLEGRTISRNHAEILQEGNQYFVRDLKSNNGTLMNEKIIPTQEKALLRSGDIIQIEDCDLLFQIPTGKEAEDIYEITDTDLLEVKMVKKLLRAMDRENAPSLEVLEGPQAGLRFVLEAKNQDVAIGRDPACEFVIDSNVISRKHSRIEKRFDTVILHDLKSKNGTFVNRERVTSKHLQDGDILHLGTLPLSFRNPQELVFDFEPPKVSEPPPRESPPPTAREESVGDSSSSAVASGAGGMRGSRRREGAPSIEEGAAAYQDAPFGEAVPAEAVFEEAAPAAFRLSPMEIVAIAVGLVVLIGSIWAILKIL